MLFLTAIFLIGILVIAKLYGFEGLKAFGFLGWVGIALGVIWEFLKLIFH